MRTGNSVLPLLVPSDGQSAPWVVSRERFAGPLEESYRSLCRIARAADQPGADKPHQLQPNDHLSHVSSAEPRCHVPPTTDRERSISVTRLLKRSMARGYVVQGLH